MRPSRVVIAKLAVATAAALLWSSSLLVGTSGTSTPLRGQPATASNGSVHLVVWSEAEWDRPRDLRAARLDGSGNALGTAFDIAASPSWDILPQVAWDGENFIVAWYKRSSDNIDLLVTRVSAEGSVLDTSGIVVARNIQPTSSPPALASGGISSLVAWFDLDGTVRSSRINRAGVALDPGGRVIGSDPLPAYTWSVSAAWHESRYLVVWDAGQPLVNYTILANRIDGATGSALDGSGVPVAAGPGPRYFPRVAGGPGGFLVVWTDGRASTDASYPFLVLGGSLRGPADYDLYGARVSDAGVVLDPGGLVIAPGQGAELSPTLAHVRGSWLVTLEARDPSGPARAATTWVTALPSLAPAAPVDASSASSQTRPALSVDASGRALVIWEDYRCGDRCSQIRGALLTGSGTTQLGVIGGDPVVRPALSVSDAPGVAEATPGTGHTQGFARFTVSLSTPASTDVSVDYKTADGIATGTTSGANGDYKTAEGQLTIRQGRLSEVVEVPVTMDRSVEPDEEFFLHLSRPSGAGLADGRGKATIYDDDPTSSATLSVDDAKVVEGKAGTTTEAIFTVKLSKPYAAPFTVRAVTVDGTAHGYPRPSNDYVHLDQVLTFARDETTKQVAVTINGDNIDERDETFFLALEDSTGPLRDKRRGVGVITNDDGFPAMSIDDVSIAEGNAGTTEARFTISLTHPSLRQISVNYATLNGTARSTSQWELGSWNAADYAPVSGVATFAPGQTTQTVVVVVNGDTLNEQDEQFVVQLSGNVNATAVKRIGVGTIRNDD